MSAPINDGGSAFPGMNDHQNGPNTFYSSGMTLRDYFAAAALTGMMAHPETRLDPEALIHAMKEGPWAIADAMLAARESKP
jgi:hypothetical protein